MTSRCGSVREAAVTLLPAQKVGSGSHAPCCPLVRRQLDLLLHAPAPPTLTRYAFSSLTKQVSCRVPTLASSEAVTDLHGFHCILKGSDLYLFFSTFYPVSCLTACPVDFLFQHFTALQRVSIQLFLSGALALCVCVCVFLLLW